MTKRISRISGGIGIKLLFDAPRNAKNLYDTKDEKTLNVLAVYCLMICKSPNNWTDDELSFVIAACNAFV